MKVVLILDSLRSVHNVGSIFRTAECSGIVSKIFLCGITPTPIDVYGRKREDLSKVALGAEDSIEWEYSKSVLDAVNICKTKGLKIISLEQAKGSINYKEKINVESAALVLGNEVSGVNEGVLKVSDYILEIPVKGITKESLNVSIALGISLFSLRD